MLTINCGKVILRPFEEKDLSDIYEYAKTDGIGEKAGWRHHLSIEVSKAVLYNQFLNQEDVYAIQDKEKGHVIGSFAFKHDSRFSPDFPSLKCYEIGYVLHKDYHNQGIMTNVVKTMTNRCFKNNSCDCLLIICCKENIASQKVATKSGFRRYKIIDNIYYPALEETKTIYCYYLEKQQNLNLNQ